MAPIDFNPSNGKQLIDLNKNNGDKQKSSGADTSANNTNKAPLDKYTESNLLKLAKNKQPSSAEVKVHEQKLASIKKQISDGTYPIMSADNETRQQFAQKVAEKLFDFDQQMDKLHK